MEIFTQKNHKSRNGSKNKSRTRNNEIGFKIKINAKSKIYPEIIPFNFNVYFRSIPSYEKFLEKIKFKINEKLEEKFLDFDVIITKIDNTFSNNINLEKILQKRVVDVFYIADTTDPIFSQRVEKSSSSASSIMRD